MNQIDRFECIQKQKEPKPRIELMSRLGGQSLTLEAASLIEQYAVSQSDTLLILDEDCPYEERLHLVLVRDAEVVDYIEIGAMYVPGVFRELGLRNNTLQFSFESDAVWTLSIEPESRRVLGGLPRGASRRGSILTKRYMFLEHGDDV
ncbi:MAG: hypothetical protein AAF941_07835 [Pseudomonadota bacterium]